MIAGILIGSMLALSIPGAYVKYLSVAVLASLDSVFGGIKALLEEKFDGAILLSGFFTNAFSQRSWHTWETGWGSTSTWRRSSHLECASSRTWPSSGEKFSST